MDKLDISPAVKWAGGKRQLLERIIERMPESYNHYFEPFVGGGAVLFGLQPEAATVNDINGELINLYQTIKEQPEGFMQQLAALDSADCDKEYYYKQRERYNEKIKAGEHDVELAALFVWLNKHCFNGLYRVNRHGLFNVPYNNKNGSTRSADDDNIKAMASFLQRVKIMQGDFEASVAEAEAGDFIFFDSPYAPINATSFEDYTKEGFAEEEHRRLAELYKALDKKGCYCMLTNHDVPLIRELYADYNIEVVEVKRLINRNANARTGTEVIITNYQ